MIGAITLALIAGSTNYVLLIGATLVSGIPQGWGNPASNALIVQHVPEGRRAVITGIKQSGVQVGTFLGGLLLPLMTSSLGWRSAVAVFIVIPVVGLVSLRPRSDQMVMTMTRNKSRSQSLSPFVKWIAIYGFLLGLGTSAMLTFLPLFAEEDRLWDPVYAGWLVAGIGLVGVGARIAWSAISHSWFGHGKTLVILAGLSAGSAGLLAIAAGELIQSWVFVPSAIVLGSSAAAWNAVGMLAIMDYSPASLVGRGTGRVLFEFLLRLALGASAVGLSIDRSDSYIAAGSPLPGSSCLPLGWQAAYARPPS